MNEDYLNVFNELFFNVNENQRVKEIVVQANYVIASLITKLGELVNEISTGISGQDNFVDIIVMLFVRKVIEQLDAINVLVSVCSFTQAEVVLRSLIENIVSLEFILKKDTKKRAAAYYLEHHYQELELAKQYLDENSKYGSMLKKNAGEEEFKKNRERIDIKKKAFENQIKSKPIFQEVDICRKRKLEEKRKKTKKYKKVYIQWYEVCSDAVSFFDLMKEIGYENYYSGIYGGLSYEAHGLNTAMEMKVNTDGANLKYVRNPEGGSNVFSLTCTFSISVLQAVYKYLNDGEEEKEEFKDFFMSHIEKRDIVINNLNMIRG
jgi:hypothetical protein